MKILLFGLLAFIGWSAFSNYIYVCKIRGFCSEKVLMQIPDNGKTELITPETIIAPLKKLEATKPEKLIVFFEFDKSELLQVSETNKFMDESADYFNDNPEARISITGFTDSVGTFKYNLSLGTRRAQSVKSYFESKGLKANRLLIQSKGESEPTENNNTEAGRAKNRRTEITINH